MLASVTDAPVPRALPLERFVEGAWALAPVDGRVRHGWLPDGRTSLVFRVLEEGRGDVSLAGPRTHARVKDVRGVVRAVVVRFKPGWTVPLFDVAASELTNRIVPLDVVWGREGADVYERLRETRDVTELVEGLSRAFTRRMGAFESSSAAALRASSMGGKRVSTALRCNSALPIGTFAVPSLRTWGLVQRTTCARSVCCVPCL